jgi:hypothetical protein
MGIVVIPISPAHELDTYLFGEKVVQGVEQQDFHFLKIPQNVLKFDCLIGAQVKLQKRLRVLVYATHL